MGIALFKKNASFNSEKKLSLSKAKLSFSSVNFILLTILLFVILFFPRDLFKEFIFASLNNKIQNINFQPLDNITVKGLNLNLDAQNLGLHYLTGLKLKNFSISGYSDQEKQIRFESAIINIDILPLFTGHFSLTATFLNKDEKLAVNYQIPLFSFFTNKNDGKIQCEFINLNFDNIADKAANIIHSILLNREIKDPNLALITPLITSINVGGRVDGILEIDMDPLQGNSYAKMKFKQLFIDIQDPSLNIPVQNFSAASLAFSLKENSFFIEKGTALKSENIQLNIDGKIGNILKRIKNYDLNLHILLSGALKDDFAFLLPTVLNCPNSNADEGKMFVHLAGETASVTCTKID